MKKTILTLLLCVTTSLAFTFTISTGTLAKETAQTANTDASDWVATPLPSTAFNVLDYGLKGDGRSDDSAALKNLAKDTSVTNWYFPAGYTFRLYKVNIPSHVTAVFGGGTLVSISTGGTGYQYGVFNITSAHQDLVIDGLTFKGESGYAGNQYFGQLQFDSEGGSTDNTQIRNCTFDAALRRADSLRVFAKSDPGKGDHTNMRVYNNTFINGQYFAMELFNVTSDPYVSDTMEGLRGLKIYGNDISGRSAWGIGIGRIRSESRIYNNTLDVNKLGTEIIESHNNHTYNNYVGARSGHTLSQGVIDMPGILMTPGVNYIHHNHFVGQKADIYHGSNSEIYENFFDCFVVIRGDIDASQTMMGHFHDNTIVSDDAHPVTIQDITLGGTFENNEVYGLTSYTGTYDITLINVNTDLNVLNNDLYIQNSAICLQPGNITESGNVCNGKYSAPVPTSRIGAGTQ